MAKSGAGLRSVHAKSVKGLAWASFIIAVADGVPLAGTFVGSGIRTFFNALPGSWGTIIAVITLIVGVVATFLDCYVDLEPNRVAVWGALLLPSIATTMSGGIASWVTSLSRTVLNGIDQWLFKAAPAGLGSTAFALAVAVAVLLMASRVVNKSRRGGGR